MKRQYSNDFDMDLTKKFKIDNNRNSDIEFCFLHPREDDHLEKFQQLTENQQYEFLKNIMMIFNEDRMCGEMYITQLLKHYLILLPQNILVQLFLEYKILYQEYVFYINHHFLEQNIDIFIYSGLDIENKEVRYCMQRLQDVGILSQKYYKKIYN